MTTPAAGLSAAHAAAIEVGKRTYPSGNPAPTFPQTAAIAGALAGSTGSTGATGATGTTGSTGSTGATGASASTATVRHAAGVPTGAPSGTELPIAFDSTAVSGGLYFWDSAAWVKCSVIP